jgi:hypothetical protein
MDGMSDDFGRKNFEDLLRTIAGEVSRSADDIARMTGVDPDQAKRWIDGAGDWLRQQAEGATAQPAAERPAEETRPAATPPAGDDPLHGAGPNPLDVPTAEQGLALAALDSGRWTIEPGTSALTSHGDGPGPRDALGLVRELRVRDWLGVDGRLTLAGRRALERWLEAT